MFGLPRRRPPTRRTAPFTTFFDPSADPDCALWVRADAQCQYDPRTQIVTSITSRLADQKVLTPAAGVGTWWRIPDLSNGFPGLQNAVATSNTLSVSGIGNGSRNLTTTVVFRNFAYAGGQATFWTLSGNYTLNTIYDYIRLRSAASSSYSDIMARFWSMPGINVFTVRQYPYDAANSNLRSRWKATLNGNDTTTHPDNTGAADWGSLTFDVGHTLSVGTQYMAAIHEVIHWNRYLSDAEVTSMHSLLAQQYSLAA